MNRKNICKTIQSIFLFSVFSCADDPVLIQNFADNFNDHTHFWSRIQVSDSTRYALVKDPLDPQNSSLIIHLHPEDNNAGGKRNEFTIKSMDSVGYRVEYSFKFMIPDDFFKKNKENDWIMIHQWHDEPPSGVNWRDYERKTRPPISLYINLKPSGRGTLHYTYGLEDQHSNNRKYSNYNEPLIANKWYTFSNVIKWSLDSLKGYSIPILNNKYLVDNKQNKEHKLTGSNMFNEIPNYYKMGVYGNYKNNDTISILFDDFQYKLFDK